MSLITLRSSTQDNGANVFESAAVWTNHFKKGIPLRPGNTLELVSMSINKIDKFEIIQGQNDTFLWRIGPGASAVGGTPVFQQHEITIPSGMYNGLELASTVQQLCNTSTIIDVFKGQWLCTYTQATGSSTGSFALTYGQRDTPANNFDANTIVDISNPTTDGPIPTFTDGVAPNTGTKIITFPKSLGRGKELGIATSTHLFQGTRGIFGKSGELVSQVTPFRVLGSVDLSGGLRNFNNLKGGGGDATGTPSKLTTPVNGYNYTVAMNAGSPGSITGHTLGAAGSLFTDGSSAGAVGSGGTTYAPDDTGTFTGGTGQDATYKVITVTAGAVSTYTIVAGGFGYTTGDTLTFDGSGDSTATCSITAVNDAAFGSGYVVGDIGDLVTVKGPVPSISAKYRVTSVAANKVTGVQILDGFKGTGYTVGDVLRLDGEGDSECYIKVTTIDKNNVLHLGYLDEQGIFGMVPTVGLVWYDLEQASINPFVNSINGSNDTFDTVGAAAGGYTFRRVRQTGTAGPSPMFWVRSSTKANQFFEYTNIPTTGEPTDTFDLISPGVFLSANYENTLTSAPWVGGTDAALLTNLVPDQETATFRYKYNAVSNVFDWDKSVDATRTITKPGYLYLNLPVGNPWTQAPTAATENFDTDDLGDIATFRRVQVGGGTSWWQATSATEWNVYTVKPVAGTAVATTAVGDLDTGVLTIAGGTTFTPNTLPSKLAAAVPFTPVFKQNYGRTGIGWVRDDLVTGRTKYPGDTNATFSLEDAECDLIFDMRSNDGSDDIQVVLTQMNNTGNQSYPTPGWRTGKTVFSTKPDSWNTDLTSSAPAPATWTQFTYGSDVVQMKILVTGIRTMKILIAHDSGGDGAFVEEVELINSGQVGMAGQSLTLNTREVFYPLRPILRMSRGSTFDGRTLTISGKMDTQNIDPSVAKLRADDGGQVESWQDADAAVPVGAAVDPVSLTALFKFGPIDGSQVVAPGGAAPTVNQVAQRDLQPNNATVQNVFGFENVYSFSTSPTNTVNTESGRTPATQILEPSLHVELTDFNIQSWSGESGDSTKAIAIIPREQWTTDTSKGTLHWQAAYPQPVELNLTETMTLYTLTARIREPSGELVKDLINPSELTLRIGETSESRQQRVMDKAMESLAGAISNRQDQKIADIGRRMPRI